MVNKERHNSLQDFTAYEREIPKLVTNGYGDD